MVNPAISAADAAALWAADDTPARPESYLQAARRRYMRNRVGLVSLGVLLALVTLSALPS